MSIKSGAKTKNQGVAGWKVTVGQTWHRNNCSHAKKKVQQKYRDMACKATFFPPYLRKAAKIHVAASHSEVRQEKIEISEQITAFVWFFCTRSDLWRLWQTALADYWSNKPLKNLLWSNWRLIWRQTELLRYVPLSSGTLWKVSFWPVWKLRWLPIL